MRKTILFLLLMGFLSQVLRKCKCAEKFCIKTQKNLYLEQRL